MTEHHRMQQAVTQALDALEYPWRARGKVLEVDIPATDRHRFRNRPRLELVFDPDLWANDRTVELVVPGCAVLESLEESLRHRGATYSTRVGGELVLDQALVDRWFLDFTVDLGTFKRHDGKYQQEQFLRFLFEVHLPGPPPRTELVPLVWSERRSAILSPKQAAALQAKPWYGEDEVAGLVRLPAMHLESAAYRHARQAAAQELAQRLDGVVAPALLRWAARVDQEKLDLEADFKVRSQTATHQEKAELQVELDLRLQRLERDRDGKLKATLSAETLLSELSNTIVMEYQHTRTGVAVTLSPRTRGRAWVDSQCAWCNTASRSYILAPAHNPPLICTRCGRACREGSCHQVLRLAERSACLLCDSPTWCARHTRPCSHCDTAACPDHRAHSACCDRLFCTDHVRAAVTDGRLLCADHARSCSVDGRWYAHKETVQCGVTGQWMALHNAVRLPDDGRPLHPDAVVVCASSGVRLARDRAMACGNDMRLHHPRQLSACGVTGLMLCSAHLAVTTWKPPERIDRRRRVTCQETGLTFDKRFAVRCSVTSKIVHRDLTVTCPISAKVLLRKAAITNPDDPRLLHPSVVFACTDSGRPVAQDRAIPDSLHPGAVLHPDHAARCELTGAVSRRSALITLACCSRRAILAPTNASHHARFLALQDGSRWVCTDHYAWCVAKAHAMPVEEVAVSVGSGKPVCTHHSSPCACHGDRYEHDRLWASPYDNQLRCTRTPGGSCRRCGLQEVLDPQGLCSWCNHPTPLESFDMPVQTRIRQWIDPHIPAFTYRTRTDVSGTANVNYVEVRTLTGQTHAFRIWSNATMERSYNRAPWQRV